jgi:hypothetical protein
VAAARALAEHPETHFASLLAGLDPHQRAVAAWELTDLGVALDHLTVRRPEDDLPPEAATLDRVLNGLYHEQLQRIPCPDWLRDLTATPPASQARQLREVLHPRIAARARRSRDRAAGPLATSLRPRFRQQLGDAVAADLAEMSELYVAGTGEAEHTEENLYDLHGHIAGIADLVAEWVRDALGPLAPELAGLVTAEPGQPGDIYDIFAFRQRQLEQWERTGDDRERTEAARTFLISTLLRYGTAADVLAAHNAEPRFDNNGRAANEEGRLVDRVVTDLLRRPPVHTQALRLWQVWPGAQTGDGQETLIRLFRSRHPTADPTSEAEPNRLSLYIVTRQLLYATLRKHLSKAYSDVASDHPDQDHRNTLGEGVLSHLTELAWDRMLRRAESDPGYRRHVREVIEGRYAGEGALPELPELGTVEQRKGRAEAAGLRRQVGFLSELAAVGGDLGKITGPEPGSRPSLLARGGTATAHFKLPARPRRTQPPQGPRRESTSSSTGSPEAETPSSGPGSRSPGPRPEGPGHALARLPEPSKDVTPAPQPERPERPGPPARHPEVAVTEGLAELEAGRLQRAAQGAERRRQAQRVYQELRSRLRLTEIPVPGGAVGDCAPDALIAMFPAQLRRAMNLEPTSPLTAARVREHIVAALDEDWARADRGEPTRYDADLFPGTTGGSPAQRHAAREIVRRDIGSPRQWYDPDGNRIVDWDNAAGDRMLHTAALVIGVRITLLGRSYPLDVGRADRPPDGYVRYGHNHYMGTRAPGPIRTAHELQGLLAVQDLALPGDEPPAGEGAPEALIGNMATYAAGFEIVLARFLDLTERDPAAMASQQAALGHAVVSDFYWRLHSGELTLDTQDRLGALYDQLREVVQNLERGVLRRPAR